MGSATRTKFQQLKVLQCISSMMKKNLTRNSLGLDEEPRCYLGRGHKNQVYPLSSLHDATNCQLDIGRPQISTARSWCCAVCGFAAAACENLDVYKPWCVNNTLAPFGKQRFVCSQRAYLEHKAVLGRHRTGCRVSSGHLSRGMFLDCPSCSFSASVIGMAGGMGPTVGQNRCGPDMNEANTLH